MANTKCELDCLDQLRNDLDAEWNRVNWQIDRVRALALKNDAERQSAEQKVERLTAVLRELLPYVIQECDDKEGGDSVNQHAASCRCNRARAILKEEIER